MKIECLTIILMVSLLACGCTGAQSPTETDEPLPSERLIAAATETVIRCNQSSLKGGRSPIEIPSEFWESEIRNLKPLKVYWHNNNLALVLQNAGSEVDGIYICVPISSYQPRDKVIQLTVDQETYTLKVQE